MVWIVVVAVVLVIATAIYDTPVAGRFRGGTSHHETMTALEVGERQCQDERPRSAA